MINLLLSLEIAPDPHWTKPLVRGDSNTSWLYPIMIGIGFIVAIALSCIKMRKKYSIPIEPFYWFTMFGIPIGIFGANFGSCVLGEPAGKSWANFFNNFGSGLAIEWGVMFVVIFAIIYFPIILKNTKYTVRDEFGEKPIIRNVSALLYFDAIAPCVLIAQFLGRWGNYFNQELYGSVVSDDAFSYFLYRCLPGMYINGEWRQPLFFYEGIGNLLMFFILYFGIEYLPQHKAGDLCAGYFLWYGIFRLCLELLREMNFFSYKTIILSAIFLSISLLYILYNHIYSSRIRKIKIWFWIKNHFLIEKLDINRKPNEMLYYCGF